MTKGGGAKTNKEIGLFLGHRNLIKNKTQTAVINILNLHILIMTKRQVIIKMCKLNMFITAVCVLFLIKEIGC